MKLLIWHCATLSSRDVRRSNRPRGISSIRAKRTKAEFSNVLAAFVCIEEQDDESTVAAARVEIVELFHLNHAASVVVVPFAHLSNKLKVDSKAALSLIESLASQLAGTDEFPVATNSFGFHKEFALAFHAHGHPGSVAFREF